MKEKDKNSVVLKQFSEMKEDKCQLDNFLTEPIQNLNEFGYGKFKPTGLQFLLSIKWFTIVYFFICVQYGLFFMYFLSSLSTVERHFHLKSKSSGLIVSSYEIGYLISIIPITFYAGQRHRPRFIAFGTIGIMIACITYTLPYFIYGPPTIYLTTTVDKINASHHLCEIKNSSFKNSSSNCSNSEDFMGSNYSAHRIFIMSIIIFGLSSTMISSLGIPFLDDNSPKENSSLYLGIIKLSRLFGPLLGYFLVVLSSRYYVDFSDPGFGNHDPRWVGCWWLGFLIVAVTIPFSVIMMLGFPRKFNHTSLDHVENHAASKKAKIQIKDAPGIFIILFKNPVYVSRVIADVFAVMSFMGYISFLNKYLETKFNTPVHESSLYFGPVFMVGFALGIGIGSFLLKTKRVAFRKLIFMMFTNGIVWIINLIILMNIDCQELKWKHNWDVQNGANCLDSCQCNNQIFSPVCDVVDRITYYSPCKAGCNGFNKINKTFESCSCVITNHTVIEGLCPTTCNMKYIYLLILFISISVTTVPTIANTLVVLKGVPPHLKSMAFGMEMLIIGALGVIPSPIIYGSQVDASCIFWERSDCGNEGSCKIYDGDQFRIRYHITGIIMHTCAILPNFICWYKSRSWKFSDEEPENENVNNRDVNKRLHKIEKESV